MKRLTFLLAAAYAFPLFAGGKAVVFVDKFVPNGECRVTAAGLQALNDRILGNVVSSRKYEVVEREHLAKVQQELKLVDSGMTDGAAPESNRLKAAGYCVYGSVVQYRSFSRSARLGDVSVKNVVGVIELQIRIANIETGRILAAKTVKAEKSKMISSAVESTQDPESEVLADAAGESAMLVVDRLNEVAFPVHVISANSRFVTGNITEDQVSVGDVWEVYVLGDELKDPQTGESLGNDEDLIATVRVSRPGPKTTKFEYGASDAVSEKCKKDILAAKEDGERMVMRRLRVDASKPARPAMPSTSGLRGLR